MKKPRPKARRACRLVEAALFRIRLDGKGHPFRHADDEDRTASDFADESRVVSGHDIPGIVSAVATRIGGPTNSAALFLRDRGPDDRPDREIHPRWHALIRLDELFKVNFCSCWDYSDACGAFFFALAYTFVEHCVKFPFVYRVRT